jgi:hypothetical protein
MEAENVFNLSPVPFFNNHSLQYGTSSFGTMVYYLGV